MTAEVPTPLYVALGDSISIDLYAGGPGRGGASLLARNIDDDFPQWQGRDLVSRAPGWQRRILATDGGTSLSLVQQQLPLFERLPAPSAVTLTIGGNDVLGNYGDTRGALRTVRQVRDRLDVVLPRVARLAVPGAPLLLGTVYDPSDGTADASSVGLPPWPDVVQVLAELNEMLRQAADRHGARVAEIHARFLGHGLQAGNPAQGLARPDDRNLWYCSVIEPNAWGADQVRAAFWDALAPL